MVYVAHICTQILTSLLGKEACLIPIRYRAIWLTFAVNTKPLLPQQMNMAIRGSDLHTHPQWWHDHHVVRMQTDILKQCTYYWSSVHLRIYQVLNWFTQCPACNMHGHYNPQQLRTLAYVQQYTWIGCVIILASISIIGEVMIKLKNAL